VGRYDVAHRRDLAAFDAKEVPDMGCPHSADSDVSYSDQIEWWGREGLIRRRAQVSTLDAGSPVGFGIARPAGPEGRQAQASGSHLQKVPAV
jgi:hypothetical protein